MKMTFPFWGAYSRVCIPVGLKDLRKKNQILQIDWKFYLLLSRLSLSPVCSHRVRQCLFIRYRHCAGIFSSNLSICVLHHGGTVVISFVLLPSSTRVRQIRLMLPVQFRLFYFQWKNPRSCNHYFQIVVKWNIVVLQLHITYS